MSLSASLPLLLAALLIEAAIGYPGRLFAWIGHPVTWIGRLIGQLDRSLNRDSLSFAMRRLAGVLALLILLGATLAASLVLVTLCRLGGPLALLPLALLASTLLAQRSLHEHVARVAEGLEQGGLAGDARRSR